MDIDTQNDYLVISASGEDKVGLVDRLSSRIAESGCNIEESRMAVLGDQLGLAIIRKRIQRREQKQPVVTYSVEVVAMGHPGIVRTLPRSFPGTASTSRNYRPIPTRRRIPEQPCFSCT